MRAPESRSLLCPAPALSDTPVRAVSRSEVLCPLMIHDEVCALVERYTIYSRGARSPSASLRRLSTMMLVCFTRYVYGVASFQLAFLLCGFAFTVQPDQAHNQFQGFFFAGTANAMGNKISSAVGMKRREDVSVIDKLTEAQLDEFREAFNSFDKVCAGCGMMMSM